MKKIMLRNLSYGALFWVLIPGMGAEGQHIEGMSDTLQLQHMSSNDRAQKALAGLERALNGHNDASVEALGRVTAAREAYEDTPSSDTEAELFGVNAGIIRAQYEALGEVVQAAESAEETLETLRKDTEEASGVFSNQMMSARSETMEADTSVAAIEAKLNSLALRMEELIGEDGRISDPQIEADILEAQAALEYQQLAAELANSEAGASSRDLRDLAELNRELRRQVGTLRAIKVRANAQRIALAQVAQSQIQRMERRDLLHRAADFAEWADGLRRGRFLSGKPAFNLPGSGGSVLEGRTFSSTAKESAVEILRKYRSRQTTSPAERRPEDSETINNETGEE